MAFPKTESGVTTSTTTTTTDENGQTKTTSTTTKTDASEAKNLTGAAGVLAGLPSGQAALLAAALMNDVAPAWTKVAPGIAIQVRPTVLPEGGAARLSVDCNFGVTTTDPASQQARQDIWAQRPADAVESHHVTTDAAVNVFDLFGISSFSIQTQHPQVPYYVPILGRLPIIGPAFQFPRSPKQTHFESLILVNTVILPRSLNLGRFYGGD